MIKRKPPVANAPNAGRAQLVTVGRAEHVPTLDPGNPLLSAREYVKRRGIELCNQGGTFFEYDGAAYRERDELAVRSDLYHFLEGTRRLEGDELVPFEPTRSKVDNVIDALRAVTNLPVTAQAPCWLDDDPGLDPYEIISFQNGLLHIPTRALLPASPTFYTHQAVPFAYDPEAPKPVHWLHTLEQLWPNDPESQQHWQEWFGYWLTPSNHFQKILLDIGPSRCGKGMRYRVLRQVVGRESYCSTSLRDLAADFGLQVLIGKSVAVISDARIGSRTDVTAVAENLLRISGEDGPSARRKHLPDWPGLLSVRFAVISNELPRIEDASGALASRFHVLHTTESWLGREDPDLEARFVPELPGILNWALEGYARLYERGRFIQPKSALELVEQFEQLGSPVRTFVRERCEVGPGFVVPKADLFAVWLGWCEEHEQRWTGTAAIFGRNLRAAVPSVVSGQRGPRGDRVEVYAGVKLLDRGPRVGRVVPRQ